MLDAKEVSDALFERLVGDNQVEMRFLGNDVPGTLGRSSML
jgi:hypothetical protein